MARRTLSPLLLALVLAAPGFVSAQTGGTTAFDRCDVDKDGVVDDREKASCAPADPCDANFDGAIDEREMAACAPPHDPCDTSMDGSVDDREKLACAGVADRCDFDQDGAVSAEEKAKCDAARDRCDADADGSVDEGEKAACAEDLRAKCDTNANGVVSPEERFRCSSTAQPCDFNEDGAVDENEKLRCGDEFHTMEGEREPCDFNQDGAIDEVEKQRCVEQARDRCDLDGDGAVEEGEKERCAEVVDRCDANGDGFVGPREKEMCGEIVRDACDSNEDGSVDDGEKRRCAAAAELKDRCDANDDGAVGPREREACATAIEERCDLNKDGAVGPMERERCQAALADGDPANDRPAIDADCRAALATMREEQQKFREGIQERRAQFLAQQQAIVEEFAKGEHTEEEWAEFKASIGAKRDAAEAEYEAALASFEATAQEHAAKCEGQLSQSGNDCRPDEATFIRFRNYVDEQERVFREESDGRIARFKAHHEAILAEATDEDRAALEEKLRLERHLFEQELDDALQRHRAAMERLWEEFKEKAARECEGGAAGSEAAGFKEIQEDQRAERLDCGLEIQAKFDAFFTANGKDASNWTDAQLGEYLAIKAEAHRLREACEERIHEAWKEKAQERFDNATRRGRLGSFDVEDDAGAGHVTGRFVAFDYEAGSLTLRDYTVQGVLLFPSFYAPHDVEDAPVRHGAVMKVRGSTATSELGVSISDNPTGSFDVSCGAQPGPDDPVVSGHPDACSLKFDDATVITPAAEKDAAEGQHRYRVEVGDRHAVLLLRGGHAWNGNTLEFRGALRLFSPSENFVLSKVANKEREKIDEAIEQENVLAEVTIALGEGDEPVAEFIALDDEPPAGAGEETVADPCEAQEGATTFELEGLKCGVVKKLDEGTGIDVVISADSDEPKTLVFNLDIGLFKLEDGNALDADDVVIEYYDVDAEGKPVKVAITEAEDIADVLDPTETAPEYWVVLDEDGLQLLVSNSHFSTKRITVATAPAPTGGSTGGDGAASGTDGPASGVPGFGAVAALATIGLAALLVRRRR